MGYIAHDAVIVTVPAYMLSPHHMGGDMPIPDVDGFRESLPEPFRRLVVGPIPAVVNGDVTYVFAPDGSKEGWNASDDGDLYRQQFLDLFSARYEGGGSPFDVIAVRFGGDEATERGCRITYAYPDKKESWVR